MLINNRILSSCILNPLNIISSSVNRYGNKLMIKKIFSILSTLFTSALYPFQLKNSSCKIKQKSIQKRPKILGDKKSENKL